MSEASLVTINIRDLIPFNKYLCSNITVFSNMFSYIETLKKYASFGGRARRSEFWTFILFNIIIGFVLGFVDATLGLYSFEAKYGIISELYSIFVFVPTLAVTIRRLHDSGKSGIWILIPIVPFIGSISLIILLARNSEPGENAFGPNPKETMN